MWVFSEVGKGVVLLARGGVRHCDVASKSLLLEGRHGWVKVPRVGSREIG
jgi:hypothetical protein